MSVHTVPETVGSKRRAETFQNGARIEIPAAAPPEERDLSPLFFTILGMLSSDIKGQSYPPMCVIQELSQDDDILQSIQHIPIDKIKNQFKIHLAAIENSNKLTPSIFRVLKGLYQVSLVNSSIPATLKNTSEQLPRLQEKLKGNIRQKISSDLRQARELLDQAKYSKTLEQLQSLLPKVDDMLLKLNGYRTLKHYLDPHENLRMRDLATLYRERRAEPQYPRMISDYPKLVVQIGQLNSELDAVSGTVIKLNDTRIQLQKALSSLIATKEKVNPLQSRFLDAFSTPLYEAFSRHFWHLAWHSLEDPEVLTAVKSVPNWRKADPNKIDYATLNALWGNYLPENELSQWILLSLESMEEEQLANFEIKLQTLEKNINELKVSPLEKEIKTQLQKGLINEMTELCTSVTQPSFSTLHDLKSFLTS